MADMADRAKTRDRLRAISAHGPWFDVRAESARAVVRIYGEIGWWPTTAEMLAAEIAQLDVPEIEVQINSPGGDVFDGLAIFNALRLHPARIVTRVDGLAASAASAIAQAGDHRVMVSSSQMMIHEAWGVCVGPAQDMLDMAALLEQQNLVLAELYAERSGRPADDLRVLMAAETWFTAQEAVDAGLADEVLIPARQEPVNDKKIDAAQPGGDEADRRLDAARLALLGI